MLMPQSTPVNLPVPPSLWFLIDSRPPASPPAHKSGAAIAALIRTLALPSVLINKSQCDLRRKWREGGHAPLVSRRAGDGRSSLSFPRLASFLPFLWPSQRASPSCVYAIFQQNDRWIVLQVVQLIGWSALRSLHTVERMRGTLAC